MWQLHTEPTEKTKTAPIFQLGVLLSTVTYVPRSPCVHCTVSVHSKESKDSEAGPVR